MPWPEQCDCYTDSDGYWQLGASCLAEEQRIWSEAIRRTPAIIQMLKNINKEET